MLNPVWVLIYMIGEDLVLATSLDGRVMSAPSADIIIDSFKPFIERLKSENKTIRIEASCGILEIQPMAVELHMDAPDIKPYALCENIVEFDPMFNIGRRILGFTVKKELLEGNTVIDIWNVLTKEPAC